MAREEVPEVGKANVETCELRRMREENGRKDWGSSALLWKICLNGRKTFITRLLKENKRHQRAETLRQNYSRKLESFVKKS